MLVCDANGVELGKLYHIRWIITISKTVMGAAQVLNLFSLEN